MPHAVLYGLHALDVDEMCMSCNAVILSIPYNVQVHNSPSHSVRDIGIESTVRKDQSTREWDDSLYQEKPEKK